MAANTSNARAERTPEPPGAQPATDTPKPLLASEVLREELAPIEPARGACRVWQLGIAAALAVLGLAMRWGIGLPVEQHGGAVIAFSAAGAVATLAVLPFPYALRAGVAVLLGVVLVALGFRGAGPLAGLTVDGGLLRHAARLLVVAVLPAALMLRARYRAYRRVRAVLAAALVLALPFVALEALLALDAGAATLPRVAAGVSIAAVCSALFGFMGEGTTGAGSVWAAVILLVLPAEVALRQLTPLADADSGTLTYAATAVAVLCAGLLASLGLFQLMAAVFAPGARRAALPLGAPRGSDSGLDGPASMG